MPNYYNFSNLKEIKTIEVNPNLWVNPLVIEYGFDDTENPVCYWRIKNTKHTFSIPITRLNYISSGDYEKHFCDVLENFAEYDYLEWKNQGFYAEWMKEYEKEYKLFML